MSPEPYDDEMEPRADGGPEGGRTTEATEPSEPTVDAAKEALARARAAAAATPRPPAGTRRTGPPRATSPITSGSGPDARDPRLLGASVEALLRDRGWTRSAAVGGLTGRWAEIVGADVAEHVVPETFEQAADGRGLLLVLRADSTAWATTLQYMLPALRSRIDEELGAGTVADISVLGPAAPSWKHGRLASPGRGPRDTYG